MTEREALCLEAACKVAWKFVETYKRPSHITFYPEPFMYVSCNCFGSYPEFIGQDNFEIPDNFTDFRAAFMAWAEARRGRGN